MGTDSRIHKIVVPDLMCFLIIVNRVSAVPSATLTKNTHQFGIRLNSSKHPNHVHSSSFVIFPFLQFWFINFTNFSSPRWCYCRIFPNKFHTIISICYSFLRNIQFMNCKILSKLINPTTCDKRDSFSNVKLLFSNQDYFLIVCICVATHVHLQTWHYCYCKRCPFATQ